MYFTAYKNPSYEGLFLFHKGIAAPFPHRAGTSQALYDGEHSSQSPSFKELVLAKLYMNEVSFSNLSVLLSLSLVLLLLLSLSLLPWLLKLWLRLNRNNHVVAPLLE